MKKKLFLGLMLTALYLYSSAQSRIEIKGTDTSAVIPIGQLRIANAKFVELKGCREENDSLFSQIRAYTGLTNNLRASIIDLKQANTLNTVLLSDKQKLIDLCDQKLKKEVRRGKILMLERNSLAGGLIILIVKIAFFK